MLLGDTQAVAGMAVVGLKTGITPGAGACLALMTCPPAQSAEAEAQGECFVSVVLGSSGKAARFVDSKRLLAWGADALHVLQGS